MKTRYLLWTVSMMLLCIFHASESFSQYDPGEPDTVRFGDWVVKITGPPYQGTAFLPVVVFNDEPVTHIDIPLGWTGPLSCDSCKFVGERPQYFMGSFCDFSNDERWVAPSAVGGDPIEPPFIPPGDGDLVHLYFSVLDTGFVTIDTITMFGFLRLSFVDTLVNTIIPQFIPTEFHILPLPGDVNGDGEVDLGDILALISYLYKNGLPPDPLDRGDVNGDCVIDLADVLYLISYLYKGGPVPQNGCALS